MVWLRFDAPDLRPSVVSIIAVSTRQKGVIAALVLAVAAVVWILVNHPVEGRTLFVVTPEHGLTEADVPALGVLVLAGLLLLFTRR